MVVSVENDTDLLQGAQMHRRASFFGVLWQCVARVFLGVIILVLSRLSRTVCAVLYLGALYLK